MDAEKTIEIQIGEDKATFHALDTRAPMDYDGFGTFEIHRYNDGERYDLRTVLVRDSHLLWQTARYSSGMFAATPTLHDRQGIIETLWNNLRVLSVTT